MRRWQWRPCPTASATSHPRRGRRRGGRGSDRAGHCHAAIRGERDRRRATGAAPRTSRRAT
eukprot:3760661-Pleurochrysis_carterae.AAC.1